MVKLAFPDFFFYHITRKLYNCVLFMLGKKNIDVPTIFWKSGKILKDFKLNYIKMAQIPVRDFVTLIDLLNYHCCRRVVE